MLVKNQQNLVNQLAEQVQTLKAEIVELTHKRDKIYNDISDQRRWKTEVYNETIVIQKDASILEALLISLKDILRKEQKDYFINSDRQHDIMSKLEKEISQKEKELEEYNKKELIDIDWLNEKYKQDLLKKRQEITTLDHEYKKKQDEIQWMEKHKQDIVKEKEELEEQKEQIKKKEKKLNLKEKRLNKLEKTLFSKK